jgi:hypothetical protein
MKTNNSKMIVVTRWSFDPDWDSAPPETASGQELPISGPDDLIPDHSDEQEYAADDDDDTESCSPPGSKVFEPIPFEIGEWMIKGPGIGPIKWGITDPNAPNVNRLVSST